VEGWFVLFEIASLGVKSVVCSVGRYVRRRSLPFGYQDQVSLAAWKPSLDCSARDILAYFPKDLGRIVYSIPTINLLLLL
jgi:hypothetical protein